MTRCLLCITCISQSSPHQATACRPTDLSFQTGARQEAWASGGRSRGSGAGVAHLGACEAEPWIPRFCVNPERAETPNALRCLEHAGHLQGSSKAFLQHFLRCPPCCWAVALLPRQDFIDNWWSWSLSLGCPSCGCSTDFPSQGIKNGSESLAFVHDMTFLFNFGTLCREVRTPTVS